MIQDPQHIFFILRQEPFPFFFARRKMSSSSEESSVNDDMCKRCNATVDEDCMACVHCVSAFCEKCDHEIQTIAPQEEYDEDGGLYRPYMYYYCLDCVSQAEE